jgi:hypothetical protein
MHDTDLPRPEEGNLLPLEGWKGATRRVTSASRTARCRSAPTIEPRRDRMCINSQS